MEVCLGYIYICIQRITLISIPHGLMARIPGFHPGGPGSIPGVGETLFLKNRNSQSATELRKFMTE